MSFISFFPLCIIPLSIIAKKYVGDNHKFLFRLVLFYMHVLTR